jgi:hypothetical protein
MIIIIMITIIMITIIMITIMITITITIIIIIIIIRARHHRHQFPLAAEKSPVQHVRSACFHTSWPRPARLCGKASRSSSGFVV